MQINRDHRGSALGTLVATAVAGGIYLWSVWTSPYGASGGSWVGLGFGICGTLCMLYAALFSARKKLRTRRLGRARVWMSLHIWLGLLAVPLIWFHSGFALGGALTTVLMVLFYIVIVSGIFGLILQQVVPGWMTEQVPAETLVSQIDHVRSGLAVDAYENVASVTGALDAAREEREALVAEEDFGKKFPANWKQVPRRPAASEPAPGSEALRQFYLTEVRPYLWRRGRGQRPPDFRAIRTEVPSDWIARVEKLRSICEESRQLEVQQRLHGLLHHWLFVHAPLSMAMFALAAVHIVFALRY